MVPHAPTDLLRKSDLRYRIPAVTAGTDPPADENFKIFPVSGLFRGRRAGDPLFRAGLGRSGPVFLGKPGFFEKQGFSGGSAGGGKTRKIGHFFEFSGRFSWAPPLFSGGGAGYSPYLLA